MARAPKSKKRSAPAPQTIHKARGVISPRVQRVGPRAYAPLFQGLRTTFSCVFEGFSRELSSNYIINTNCNALYSPITYRKVATM